MSGGGTATGGRSARRPAVWERALVGLILAALLWRAWRSWQGFGLRTVALLSPRAVIAKLEAGRPAREAASFGADLEVFRVLDRSVPKDGIVSVWGVNSEDRRLLTTTLDAHLFPRRAEQADRLEEYFRTHPERLDSGVYVLCLLPSDPLPGATADRLEEVYRSSRAVVYRWRGEASPR